MEESRTRKHRKRGRSERSSGTETNEIGARDVDRGRYVDQRSRFEKREATLENNDPLFQRVAGERSATDR